MNKTVTVNIGGIVFHIEENAYDMLGSYLQAIRNHLPSAMDAMKLFRTLKAV